MKRLVGIVLVALAPQAYAYPISPRTLWQLVEEADLVVVGKVENLAGKPVLPRTFKELGGEVRAWHRGLPSEAFSGTFFGGRGDDGYAHLQVLETLKGTPISDAWVETHAGMVCPAPPQFVPGEKVLTFLKSHGDGEWNVVALSYGTLYVDDQALEVFKARIREAAELQKAEKLDEKAKLDWLVRVASRRATRWHGAYELRPEGDAVHHYYDRDKRQEKATLTDEHRASLARGFVDEPSSGSTVPMIIAAVGNHASSEFDATVAGVIEGAIANNSDAYWLHEAMLALARRLNLLEVLKDIPEFTEGRANEVAVQGAWERIKKARPELRVKPIDVDDQPKVRGTGADTPP